MRVHSRSLFLASLLFATSASADPKTASLQVIHNAADPAAAVVDVYVNGDRLLDDFAFRTATPFVDVPAGVTLRIGIAPGTSTSADQVIATFDVELKKNRRYVAVANGVLGSGFAPNPGGRSTAFRLYLRDEIRVQSGRGDEDDDNDSVALIAFHGATDAPAVDILVRNRDNDGPLFEKLKYGKFSQYRRLDDRQYILDITPAHTGDDDDKDKKNVLVSYDADLRGLGGGAAIVFASGFLNPAANEGGPAFGLFAALPDGRVVGLPVHEDLAQVQVIHNSADPGAASVDIYVNGSKAIDNFAFRSATPFLDLPANTPLAIGVAPGTSAGAADIIATFDLKLKPGEKYVVVANGVLDPTGFAANPNQRSTGFKLFIADDIATRSSRNLVRVLAFHGATDAPAVDIWLRTPGSRARELFEHLVYGKFKGQRSLPPVDAVLDVTPAGDETVLASFRADLTGLQGSSAVVFASGFLTPATNQNGAAFGLYAALPSGQVVALPAATGPALAAKLEAETTAAPTPYALDQNSPNPFNPTTRISFALPTESRVSLRVFDTRGRVVTTLVDGPMPAGRHNVAFQGEGLASGTYFYRLDGAGFSETRKMLLVK